MLEGFGASDFEFNITVLNDFNETKELIDLSLKNIGRQGFLKLIRMSLFFPGNVFFKFY